MQFTDFSVQVRKLPYCPQSHVVFVKCWFEVIRLTHATIARFKTVHDTSQNHLLLRSKSAPNNINNAKFPVLNHPSLFGWNVATPRDWKVSVGVMIRSEKKRHRSINQKVQITCQFQLLTYIDTIPRHVQCFHRYTAYTIYINFTCLRIASYDPVLYIADHRSVV